MNAVWEGIVKVQRSVHTNEPAQQCMVYNESRDFFYLIDLPKDIERLFKPGEWKFYANATWKDGKLNIEKRIEPQAW